MADKDAVIERIARETLDIPFVHRRKASGLDFYEVAVWNVADALAWNCGNSWASTRLSLARRDRRARTSERIWLLSLATPAAIIWGMVR